MRTQFSVGGTALPFACACALIASACSAHDGAAAVAADAADLRCATQAIPLGTHPHAIAQRSALGQTLADTRGWHGQLYFIPIGDALWAPAGQPDIYGFPTASW